MYSDTEEWTRIRARVLIKGESIRHVANAEAISRNTVRKMVRLEFPPGYLRKCVNERQSVVDQPTTAPWTSVQRVVRSLTERQAARFLRDLFAPGVNDEFEVAAMRRLRMWAIEFPATDSRARSRQRWQNWMYRVEQGVVYAPEGGDGGQQEKLMRMLVPVRRSQRHKSLTVLAHEAGFSARQIATHLAISRGAVRESESVPH
ncbi:MULTISPECIES: hypothetical protein [Paraburkholderia]|uniref:hypothetical protein n=1 Tax=Paraburkholderia TaxID=1822464 RepID=UPI0038BCAAF2